MSSRQVRVGTLSGSLFAVVAGALLMSVIPLSSQQPVFRSGTAIVPVDVRVLDKKGLPVTDLKAEDFTVMENGTPQKVTFFSAQGLTPGEADDTVPVRHISDSVATLPPQNRRLFLIVLGRGRLQGPSRGLDALATFVRSRLLPQDLVALMAWNRATDFTTNHERVATVLDRFKTRHEDIETDLSMIYSGLGALYAGRQIPRPVQIKIDDVFNVPNAGTREVNPGTATSKAAADAKTQADSLQRKSEIEARLAAYRQFNTSDLALGDLMDAATLGTNFDDYVALSRQTLQDVGNVYAGIDYLRFIEGEKHLVLVTEQGFLMPSASYDRDVASLAADARVAIDTFQTGGVAPVMVGGFPVVTAANGFALSALRTVADRSGGQVSVSEKGSVAIDRIVHATEFGYVLGYVSTNPEPDGKFRKIKVETKRKGATLAYRSGYFARPPESFDPRKSIATTRMVNAANVGADIRDLKIGIAANETKAGAQRIMTVETLVPADRIVFGRTPTGYIAALSQAILCNNSNGENVGELWRQVDVNVPAAELDRVKREGLKLTTQVPVSFSPTWVRVIIYDYGSDLLGSLRIKRY